MSVELLLADWIPRKIVADVGYLSKAPEVLRAFVRFCHDERSIRASLTAETLEAVDRWEPGYQKAIRSPRPQGAEALLAAVAGIDPDGPWEMPGGALDDGDWDDGDWDGEPRERRSRMQQILESAVGGADALHSLDDAPLPDEPFDWIGIPEAVHGRASEVLEISDRICTEVLDTEYRTAARRLLAHVASHGGGALQWGRADIAAAAICLAIGRVNDLFHYSRGRMTQKDFFARCGVKQSSIAQRATSMLHASGLAGDWSGSSLGSPRYLVAERRQRIMATRDRFAVVEDRRSMPCTDCGTAPVGVYVEGVAVCDACADKRIVAATGCPPLPDLPGPVEVTGPDGRRHRFAFRSTRVATGITVSLEELGVEPGEGYRFEVLGSHDGDLGGLVAAVRAQAEAGISQLWLKRTRYHPGWDMAGDELSGRIVHNPEGGLQFRLIIEDRTIDLRPEGDDQVIDVPYHVILHGPAEG